MNSKADNFEFTSYQIKENKREIELKYALEFEDKSRLNFTETLTLPMVIPAFPPEINSALDKTLLALHLMCGLSYWKTYCPSTITIKTTPLTKNQAQFWQTVYTKGLGEFFYENKINFKDLVTFPYSENAVPDSVSVQRQERALLGVGGGKDSLVTYEMIREQYPSTLFLLETQKGYDLINDVVKVMKAGVLRIQRTIDRQLFDSQLLKGAYNGHIPITAIYSIVGVLCSILYDYRYVVLSNEKSANYGNVIYLGEEINHQWSKSVEFEELFQSYVHENITPNISCFSLLRPWSEMRITQEFIKYPQYFNAFSSCNSNFKVDKETLKDGRWCGKCPKCAFVFAMLAAFLPKSEVVKIFNKNLFADQSLLNLYKELAGVKDFKPFECVGTPEEVKAALFRAYQAGEYSEDVIMKFFVQEVLPKLHDPDILVREVESAGDDSLIPEKFKSLLSNNRFD